MICYRLYTEEKNTAKVLALASRLLEGFTVLHGEGYWQNTHEPALVLEVLSHHNIDSTLDTLAQEILLANDQQEVLITTQYVGVQSVKAKPRGGDSMSGSEAISAVQKQAVLKEYARNKRDGNMLRANRILEANKHNITLAEFEAAEA